MIRAIRLSFFPLCALCVLCAFAVPSEAGGGPETVLVVVNADSPASLRVANAYVRMRKIPASHVCPIRGVPNLIEISVEDFRQKIWGPIERHMKHLGLEDQIDIIAYSADFPFGVNYDGDFHKAQLPQGVHKFRRGSLTGMTYLIRHVKEKSREYLYLPNNLYLRWLDGELLPGHAFRSRDVWGKERRPEKLDPEDPEVRGRYYLSTMLGFTGMQGNSVPEILSYLEAGAASDGTNPKGSVYLMHHKDIRARTRMPYFPRAMEALKHLGRSGVILKQGDDGQDGRVPIGKKDVIGLMAGIASFNWEKSKSEFLPGAIAEHLTSFGAQFDGSGQTKISEFLRAGAVGSAGTVREPYSIAAKFPLPFLHVHYAEGCCLAEAFYQSIGNPYQLLVIGDPLARPYASFAKVSLDAPDAKSAWSGAISVTPKVVPAKGTKTRAVELWIDGRYVAEAPAGKPIPLDTTKLFDGAHELRLVAVEDSLVGTRSFCIETIRVKHGTAEVTIKGPRKGAVYGERVKLSGKASGVKQVDVLVGTEILEVVEKLGARSWRAEIDTARLGVGTISLRAFGLTKDGAEVHSPVFELEVHAPGGKSTKKRRPARKKKSKKAPKGGGKRGGLKAVVTDAKGKEHDFAVTIVGRQRGKQFLKELRAKVKGKPKKIRLEGEMEIKGDGLYRFAINAAGDLSIKIDGKSVFDGKGLADDRQAYAGFGAKTGWRAIEIDYEPTGNGNLSIWLGGDQVSSPLQGKAIRH